MYLKSLFKAPSPYLLYNNNNNNIKATSLGISNFVGGGTKLLMNRCLMSERKSN